MPLALTISSSLFNPPLTLPPLLTSPHVTSPHSRLAPPSLPPSSHPNPNPHLHPLLFPSPSPTPTAWQPNSPPTSTPSTVKQISQRTKRTPTSDPLLSISSSLRIRRRFLGLGIRVLVGLRWVLRAKRESWECLEEIGWGGKGGSGELLSSFRLVLASNHQELTPLPPPLLPFVPFRSQPPKQLSTPSELVSTPTGSSLPPLFPPPLPPSRELTSPSLAFVRAKQDPPRRLGRRNR